LLCILHCRCSTVATHCGWIIGTQVASCITIFTAEKLQHAVRYMLTEFQLRCKTLDKQLVSCVHIAVDHYFAWSFETRKIFSCCQVVNTAHWSNGWCSQMPQEAINYRRSSKTRMHNWLQSQYRSGWQAGPDAGAVFCRSQDHEMV